MSEFALARLWAEVLSHLWQTGTVLLVLAGLAAALRSAPAWVEHSLWTAGLVKLAVPLSLGGALAAALLPGALDGVVPGVGHAAPVWIAPGDALASAPATGSIGLLALTLLWGAGALRGLLRVAADVAAAARLARRSRPPERAELNRLAPALRGSRVDPARIRVTSAPIGSVVVGILRPRILVGERVLAALSAAELRGVLEHEEAHRRRLDPARTLARRILAAAFFLFPPVVFLARRLHETAEYACDEFVLRSVPAEVYARALARVTRLGLEIAPAPAVLGDPRGSLLSRRFRRLESPRRSHMMPIHRAALAAAVVAVLAASFSPRATAEKGGEEDAVFDEAPKPVHVVQPDYPERARSEGVEGTVVLRVEIGTDGKPRRVAIVSGVEGHPELADSAVKALRQWRFDPATKEGEAVVAEVSVPFRFALDEKHASTESEAKGD